MKQQIVLQDMSEAPKDREILVGIKSEVDGYIRFYTVVYDEDGDEDEGPYDDEDEDEDSEDSLPNSKNTWFSDDEDSYFANDELVGWIEVPVLPQAK